MEIPAGILKFVTRLLYMGVKNFEEGSEEIVTLTKIIDQISPDTQNQPLLDRLLYCAKFFTYNVQNLEVNQWAEQNGLKINQSTNLQPENLIPAQISLLACLQEMVSIGFLNIHSRTIQIYQETCETLVLECLAAGKQEELSAFNTLLNLLAESLDEKDYNITDSKLLKAWAWAVVMQSNSRSEESTSIGQLSQPAYLIGHQYIWGELFVEQRFIFNPESSQDFLVIKKRIAVRPMFHTSLKLDQLMHSDLNFWMEFTAAKIEKDLSIRMPVGPEVLFQNPQKTLCGGFEPEQVSYQPAYPFKGSLFENITKGVTLSSHLREVSYRNLIEGIPVFLNGEVDFKTATFKGLTGEVYPLAVTHKKALLEDPNCATYCGTGFLHYIDGSFCITLAHMGYNKGWYAMQGARTRANYYYNQDDQALTLVDMLKKARLDLIKKKREVKG